MTAAIVLDGRMYRGDEEKSLFMAVVLFSRFPPKVSLCVSSMAPLASLLLIVPCACGIQVFLLYVVCLNCHAGCLG